MKPYVKQYENGILVNQITKEQPYLHPVNVLLSNIGKSSRRYWAITRNRFFTGKTATRW